MDKKLLPEKSRRLAELRLTKTEKPWAGGYGQIEYLPGESLALRDGPTILAEARACVPPFLHLAE